MAHQDISTGRFTFSRFCIRGHDTSTTGRNVYSACFECVKVASRKHGYKKRYGITIDRFNAMFAAHLPNCAICEKPQSALNQKLNVDHDHVTGRIRGLLCASCNKNLGIIENRPFCLKASLYLQEK